MAHTRLLFRDQAREKILAGAAALADAVRATLGPKSRSMLLERKFSSPIVCDDGVTIAKRVDLPDPEQNLGAQMLREAAIRTGEAVGDGTTTSTLLAHAILADGVRNVAAGASAVDLKRGLDRGVAAAVEALRAISKPVTVLREKEQVASISAHGNVEIGRMVARAIERVGSEGIVTVEEARGTETSLEIVEGMQFDRGFLSPYFVTNAEKVEAVLEEPLVILHEKRIGTLRDLLPLLERIAKEGRAFLLIAEDVEGEALATLVVNKLRGTLQACAVKAPGFGDRRKEILRDIATLCGGTIVSEELGLKLENLELPQLGKAKRVIVNKDTTTIIGGGGDPTALKGRCEELRRAIADSKSDYDREKLEERLAKLSGGVAVIRVGAPSEAEMKSRREAFDDAINATKAAVAEGIVPGAGLALLRAIPAVEAVEQKCEGDERTGVRILRQALEAPTRQIAVNSGCDAGVVVERMRAGAGSFGFDAARGRYVDLVEAGIIDAAKVIRSALDNAVSVAGVLLLAEGTLTEMEEKKGAGAGMPEVE
ncbi:MAG TPA: chaperonin GroEL [Myxococcota bacterium]|nr:chaperonin GroEL [Myxococcota bacterium]